jgi:uncharacterized protein
VSRGSIFPRWDRNLNTGRPDEMAVARQSVVHDTAHPSLLILPIA